MFLFWWKITFLIRRSCMSLLVMMVRRTWLRPRICKLSALCTHSLHVLLTTDSISKLADITEVLQKSKNIVSALHFKSYVVAGERNQVMRKFCAEEFRLLMKCRHHQRGLFATMVVELLTCPILALSRSVHRFHRARRGDSEGLSSCLSISDWWADKYLLRQPKYIKSSGWPPKLSQDRFGSALRALMS